MSLFIEEALKTVLPAALLFCLASAAFAGTFVEKYGDFEAKKAWDKANITSAAPPFDFSIGGVPAEKVKWICGSEKPRTVTDFEGTASPAERTVTEINYTAPDLGLLVTVEKTDYPGCPVTEYRGSVTNISEKASPRISGVKAFSGKLASFREGVVHYNRGSNAFPCLPEEYEPLTAPVSPSKPFEIGVEKGLPTAGFLPCVNVKGAGRGVIAALDWQGSWTVRLESRRGMNISMGQRETDLSLLPGEKILVPGAVFLFYKGDDRQEGQNIWRRWIIEHNLLRNTGRRDFRENVFICSDLRGYDEDMKHIANPLIGEIGRKFNAAYEFDYGGSAGWFGMGNMAPGATGNWSIAENYGGGRLRELSDRLREKNIGFCLWLEPERCYKGTEAAEALGEENVLFDGDMGLVDYGRPAVQRYILNLLDGLVKNQKLTIYRQDFNIWNEPFWSEKDKREAERLGIPRTGITENHAAEGYIETWTKLEERNPGLVFDSCAGGGRRNDLSTLRFSFMHTKSDYWGPAVSQQCQVFGALSWFIFVGTGFQDTSSLYDVRSRPTLSIGIGAPGINEETMSALEEWRSLHKYMYNDFYQLTDYSLDTEKNLAMEFNDYENREGEILVYLRMGGAERIFPRGWDKNANYEVRDRDYPERTRRIVSGKDAMEKGILAARGNEPSAAVLEYRAVEEALSGPEDGAILAFFGAKERPAVTYMVADEAELRKAPALKGAEAEYFMPDGMSTGGIYAVGKGFYDAIPFEDKAEENGWRPIDNLRFGIWVDEEYGALPMRYWNSAGFPVTAWGREAGGRYFVWLKDTFGFGDPDGAWKNGVRRLAVIDPEGGNILSGEFTFCANEFGKLPGREIRFGCYDTERTGTIYVISDRIYESIKGEGEGPLEKGIRWRGVNDFAELLTDGDISLWAGEKDGTKYLYLQGSRSKTMSDRTRLYFFDKERKVYTYTVFYLYGRHHRAGGDVQPENVSL